MGKGAGVVGVRDEGVMGMKRDAPFDGRWNRRENMRGSESERMEQG